MTRAPFVVGAVAAVTAFTGAAVIDGEGGAVSPQEAPRGAALFAEMGCGSCHSLAAADASGDIAPDLDGLLAGHTRESLAAVIASPPGRIMPPDYGARMTAGELDELAGWLLSTQ